jgi:hypothetical protein
MRSWFSPKCPAGQRPAIRQDFGLSSAGPSAENQSFFYRGSDAIYRPAAVIRHCAAKRPRIQEIREEISDF